MLGKVDAVVTDPPYEKEAHTIMRRVQSSPGVLTFNPISFDPITEELRDSLCEWAAKNCTGWALCFCQSEAIAAYRDSFEAAGAKYKRPMIWIKPDGMPQFNGQMPGMGWEAIVAAWCGSGHSRWNGGGSHGVFYHNKSNGGKNEHETQKPVSLMLELINLFTDSSDLVADPFCGSGTTGVACVKANRRFIGCEISEKYFDIACRRIQAVANEPRLPLPEPKARQEKMVL